LIKSIGIRRPYNLYCVGGDVKPCSINQSIREMGDGDCSNKHET